MLIELQSADKHKQLAVVQKQTVINIETTEIGREKQQESEKKSVENNKTTETDKRYPQNKQNVNIFQLLTCRRLFRLPQRAVQSSVVFVCGRCCCCCRCCVPHVVMLTNRAGTTTLISLWLMLWLTSGANGATVTWGQVNKYASTLHAQDVYLPHPKVDVDVVYGSQNDQAIDGYTITAVHAYDMTPLALHGGDGGTAQLLSGGVGQQHARVRFKRHSTNDQLPEAMHFQLVIYGINL